MDVWWLFDDGGGSPSRPVLVHAALRAERPCLYMQESERRRPVASLAVLSAGSGDAALLRSWSQHE